MGKKTETIVAHFFTSEGARFGEREVPVSVGKAHVMSGPRPESRTPGRVIWQGRCFYWQAEGLAKGECWYREDGACANLDRAVR